MSRKNILIVIGAIVLIGVSFFAGMEFKAYQIRSTITDAFSGMGDSTDSESTVTEQLEKENSNFIESGVNQDIKLATIDIKVTDVSEEQSISSTYSSPKVAREGTKFVIVGMEVTNTTTSAFSLPADFILVDDKGREFQTYSDSIGSVENYLDYRELSPSVKEAGVYVYEIPNDSTSYSLLAPKAGSKDVYRVKLK